MKKRLRRKTRTSVESDCRERMRILRSRYEEGSLVVCAEVQEAHAKFDARSTDFDCVTRLLLRDDPVVRSDAAKVLREISRLRDGWPASATDLRRSPLILDPDTKPVLDRVLSNAEKDSGVPMLLDALATSRVFERKERIRIAFLWLEHHAVEIQLAAINLLRSCSQITDKEVVERLIQLLGKSTNPQVRIAVCKTLASFGNEGEVFVEELIDLISKPTDQDVEEALARTVWTASSDSISDALSNIVDAEIQVRLTDALRRVGPETHEFRKDLELTWRRPCFPSVSKARLARLLGIDATTVASWIESKKLPIHGRNGKEYRVDPRDIEFLTRSVQQGKNKPKE